MSCPPIKSIDDFCVVATICTSCRRSQDVFTEIVALWPRYRDTHWRSAPDVASHTLHLMLPKPCLVRKNHVALFSMPRRILDQGTMCCWVCVCLCLQAKFASITSTIWSRRRDQCWRYHCHRIGKQDAYGGLRESIQGMPTEHDVRRIICLNFADLEWLTCFHKLHPLERQRLDVMRLPSGIHSLRVWRKARAVNYFGRQWVEKLWLIEKSMHKSWDVSMILCVLKGLDVCKFPVRFLHKHICSGKCS